MSDALVTLRGLVKHYGRRRALDGVDLTIDERQIFGVVGPDGAGKTTLLRTLAGLLEIQATEARVLGHDLRADVTELKARIGYVAQTFSLHPDLTVEENLRFTARLHRLPERELQSRMRALLDPIGLAPFTARRAGALSGGMKQKLAVANALLTHPDLLILDEPTAGVDVGARAELWTMLASERTRALVVVSTSYLDEAAACDRIAYLDAGRVVATGTPEHLRERVPLELYRAWGDDARAIARAARALPYVQAARATGRFARVEVPRDRSPDAPRVLADLRALPSAGVWLAEQVPVDMESTLLALARGLRLAA